jgi:hypothetical protein
MIAAVAGKADAAAVAYDPTPLVVVQTNPGFWGAHAAVH